MIQSLFPLYFCTYDVITQVSLDVTSPNCHTRRREIHELGHRFYDGKYQNHFDNLLEIGSRSWTTILSTSFGEDWAHLTRDLLFDSEGTLKLMADLWNAIRKVIVPTLIDKVGYIPIPRIEYTEDNLDLVENLTLSGRNLFPNFMSLEPTTLSSSPPP